MIYMIVSLSLGTICIILYEYLNKKSFYKPMENFLYPYNTCSIKNTTNKNFYYLMNQYSKVSDDDKLELQLIYYKTKEESENNISTLAEWYAKLLYPVLLAMITVLFTFSTTFATISSKHEAQLKESVLFMIDTFKDVFNSGFLALFIISLLLFLYVTIKQTIINDRKRILRFHISIITHILDKRKKKDDE
ncbi:hypothetical protein Elgi_52780 [Paenibacillus elgii]|nr:hypothetical protein Elgi_52780 [Paenibacillus elgii]